MDVEKLRRLLPVQEHLDRPIHDDGQARTRRLIGELYKLSVDWLRGPLQRTLDNFSKQLFELADHTRDGIEQQAYMHSRELLLQGQMTIQKRFIENLRLTLDHIGEPVDTPDNNAIDQPLSLVSPVEQETTAALEQLTARGVARGGEALFELGYRLAVLIAAAPLEDMEQPLGPRSLARAFHDAASLLGLPHEHHLQLLNNFDRVLIRNITPLYELANRHLLADGILPQLRVYPTPAPVSHNDTRESTHNNANTQETAHTGDSRANSEPISVLEGLREMLAERRGGHSGASDSNMEIATADELQMALDALQQHATQVTDHANRELRSAQRLREEMLTQLNASRPAGTAHSELSGEQNDTIELIAMMFEQLGNQVKAGGNARSTLGGLELPILRMAINDHSIFEQSDHPARRLLGTVTKAANDWLDAPGNEPDRVLKAKLEQLIERASVEPPSADLYTSLLADIEHHLSALQLRAKATERRHVEAMKGRERMDQARQRATELMAERFAKSPPHGLLRALLDLAWTDVLTLTLLRHGEHDPICIARLAVTDQLLGLATTPDRTQLQGDVQKGLLQIGMAAEEAVQVAQRLVASEEAAAAPTAGTDPISATELIISMKRRQRLGSSTSKPPPVPQARAPAISGKLSAPSNGSPDTSSSPAPAPSAVTDPEIVTSPPAPSPPASPTTGGRKLSKTTAVPTPATTRSKSAVSTPNPREASIRQRLQKLPFGTLFEFIDAADGQTVQRKLAWYSPMSGQALFVTRRGQRSFEMNLADLTHRIAVGKVHEVPLSQENLFDRAWRAFTTNMRVSNKPAHPDTTGRRR